MEKLVEKLKLIKNCADNLRAIDAPEDLWQEEFDMLLATLFDAIDAAN